MTKALNNDELGDKSVNVQGIEFCISRMVNLLWTAKIQNQSCYYQCNWASHMVSYCSQENGQILC